MDENWLDVTQMVKVRLRENTGPPQQIRSVSEPIRSVL